MKQKSILSNGATREKLEVREILRIGIYRPWQVGIKCFITALAVTSLHPQHKRRNKWRSFWKSSFSLSWSDLALSGIQKAKSAELWFRSNFEASEMRKDIKIVLESIWYLILPVFIFVLNVRYWHGYLSNPGWSLTHPSYIVFGFILSAALCFEIVYIDIKFGEK